MKRLGWGWLLLAVAATLAVAGVLPRAGVLDAWRHGWPVLAFLVLIKPVADLCGEAGLFTVAADRLALVARGSGAALFWMFCGLAAVTTMLLSLDTTAVLLTPVGVVLARRLRLDPRPFAFAAVWLANSASLLLPISNLTNLMVHEEVRPSYLAAAWLPQLGVLAVTAVLLWLRWGRHARGSFAMAGGAVEPGGQASDQEPPGPLSPGPAGTGHDRVLLGASMLVAVALGPLLVAGVPAWLVAAGALAFLWLVFALRGHRAARPLWVWKQLPLEVAAAVLGLFWLVSGVSAWLAAGLPQVDQNSPGTAAAGAVLVASIGALAANLVNNLPAFLALQQWAGGGGDGQLMALLVGVNVGPSVLVWGSLANILWWQSCRRHGLHITARRFAVEGLALVPAAVLVGALLTAVG